RGSWPSRECAAGCVRDFMTPVFFSVRAEMPAARGIREIRALRLHHLFVISGEQQVVGIIDGTELLECISTKDNHRASKSTNGSQEWDRSSEINKRCGN